MTAITYNLDGTDNNGPKIEQGATYVLEFQWCEEGPDPDTPGDPHDLTDAVARMQIRKKQGETPVVNASSDGDDPRIVLGVDPDGPSEPDPTNGWIRVTLTAEDTDGIVKDDGKVLASSKYDLEVELSDGTVHRLLEGSVTTDPNITQ